MKLAGWLLRWMMLSATLLLAIWLCWQCADIWLDGSAPENTGADGVFLTDAYTPAGVAERLAPLGLALPAYAVLVLVALAAGGGREKPLSIPAENRLAVMKRRLPENAALPAAAQKEERLRQWVRIALAAALLLCAIPAGLFLLDGRNFASWELEAVMGALIRHVLPWTAAAIAAVWAAEEICRSSMEREASALKPVAGSRLNPATEKLFPAGAVRVLLAGAAIVFIVLGVMNGGLRDVLVKAINICTECIGLG